MGVGEAFAVGIAPMHVPALIAALLLPIVVLFGRRLRAPRIPGNHPATALGGPVAIERGAVAIERGAVAIERGAVAIERGAAAIERGAVATEGGVAATPGGPGYEGVSGRQPETTAVRLWAAWLLGISGAVHLALPLGHYDGPVLTAAFVGSGVAYGWLGLRAWEGRSWRLLSALLIVATLIAYLVVTGTGGEEPDQVGIATALVELVALGLCLVPAREAVRRKRFKRFAGSTGTVFSAFVVGVVVWAGSLAAHAATDGDVAATDPQSATVGHTADHAHAHDHAARAQAGIIMRPQADHHPTAEQAADAEALAAATKAAMTRFASLDTALAEGFALPGNATGPDVHLDNKANKNDGRVLDPEHPETLVYAISGGRATLLGVVYVMERAGVAAPQPGGPITRWHAHNICITLLPPGFGGVTPFGSCPALSIALTTPEMMHVWVVENPDGAFAEGLDKEWVTAYHALHGIAYAAG